MQMFQMQDNQQQNKDTVTLTCLLYDTSLSEYIPGLATPHHLCLRLSTKEYQSTHYSKYLN